MKRSRRNPPHLKSKFERLRRLVEVCLDASKPRRLRTRSARYAAALAEQLGLITRAKRCTWCRRRQHLERHHWDYGEPLNITYLCSDCHALADSMVCSGIA